MAKNIVICSDGTGNTFAKQVSNVTRLIKSIRLDNPVKQVVCYDQGIGTNPKLVEKVKAFKKEPGVERDGLFILPKPTYKYIEPISRLGGLLVGTGFPDNLKEMYQELAKLYEGEQDQIYLFGFSRGAFTVRALAGLVYRCGLPSQQAANNSADFDECFAMAYKLYVPHSNNEDNKKLIQEYKAHYQTRECQIHFLGIWDTVKSYGGVDPISLPHLRHNPIVRKICHALAIHEHRAWFVHTTWGWLDCDLKNQSCIEPDGFDNRFQEQEIKEVWFRGYHSDVGGGDDEERTAEVPLRWMLREASNSGLLLNETGQSIILSEDSKADSLLELHESRSKGWPISDYIPRRVLNNENRASDCGPTKELTCKPSGTRPLDKFRRKGFICLHSSVGSDLGLQNVYHENMTFFSHKGWQ
jgi:uncharacterized protein (DUF2235 family)